MMRRRTFIAGLASAVARPVVVRAQQSNLPVIGYLGAQSAELENTIAFLRGLKDTGHSPCWRPAMRCLRSTQGTSSPLPVV
jgi:hypothetical protein